MAETLKMGALGESPVLAASAVFERFSAAMTEAADRGLAVMGAGFDQWAKESQLLFEEISAQGLTALERLKTCKSALDVLDVEQTWFAARSKAYMDSGMRFTRAFTSLAERLAAAPPSKAPPAPSASA